MSTRGSASLGAIFFFAVIVLSAAGYFYWRGQENAAAPKLIPATSEPSPFTPTLISATTPPLSPTQPLPKNTPTFPRISPSAEESPIVGSVSIYRINGDTMTVQLIAQSSEGNVTSMKVWTDSNNDSQWRPFSALVKIPTSEFVYAQYLDDRGNLSQVYSDTIHPPQGPPNSM
jgi:hypothetical protein